MILNEKLPNETKPEYVLRLLKVVLEQDIEILKNYYPQNKVVIAKLDTLQFFKKFIAKQELTYELYDSLMGDL